MIDPNDLMTKRWINSLRLTVNGISRISSRRVTFLYNNYKNIARTSYRDLIWYLAEIEKLEQI